MRRFDFSVAQRLGAAAVLKAALIATLGLVIALFASRLQDLRYQQREVIAPRAQAAKALEQAVYQQAIAFRNFAIRRTPADLEAFRASEAEVERRAERLAKIPKAADGTAIFESLRPAIAEHQRAFARYLELAAAGADRDTLGREELKISGWRMRVLALVRDFTALQERQNEAAEAAVDTAIARLLRTTLAVTLLILTVFVLTSWFVTRSVRRPATTLIEAARSLSSGDFGPALALEEQKRRGGPFRDELREASHVFGQMAATLKSREERLAALARDLQEANEQLNAQNEELQAQSEELQAQGEELQVQSEELQAQNEELQAQSDELHAQQEALARTNEELLRAEAQKNRFLAVLGHELRNPLAAVRGAIDLLQDRAANGDDTARLEAVIRRQASHLGRLLDDLLDIGRITSGKIVIAQRPIDLAAAVRRCVELVDADSGFRGRKVVLRADEPLWIDADETRVEQVVTNLLTNALKFTPDEGSISVTVERSGTDAVLRVADTGVGVDPGLLPRIFEFFVQGDTSARGARSGLGIGLTLVKNLVELHGGSVEAASEGRGKGTTFTVRFPALDTAPSNVAVATPQKTRPRRSVVLVEDNADVRTMMKFMLKRSGHDVAEADDGPGGVERVSSLRPHVALVDLDLPGFDGCEVAKRIRVDPALSGVRLIAVSGYGSPEDRARALAAGFDEHMVKPIDFERLMRTLEEPDGVQ